MTRKEFMRELREGLSRLPANERDAALAYYEEYFEEAGSDHEQDVIRELGSPASVAARILADHAVKAARESPYNPRKGFSAFWAVLLALFAAPLAIPVIVALVGIIIAVVAVVIAIGTAAIGLVVGGVALFTGGFFGLFATPATAIILFGAAFLLWGLGKIVFVIAGAVISLLGGFVSWLFDRTKGDRYAK